MTETYQKLGIAQLTTELEAKLAELRLEPQIIDMCTSTNGLLFDCHMLEMLTGIQLLERSELLEAVSSDGMVPTRDRRTINQRRAELGLSALDDGDVPLDTYILRQLQPTRGGDDV